MGKKQKPVDLQALYQEALQLHQQGRPDEAISLYSTIAIHVPDIAEVHYNLGLAFFETEQFGLAAGAYRKAAELHPDDSDTLYNLGLACKMDMQYAEAETAYLKALALEPGSTDIRYNLGCCYRDAGAIKEAGAVFAELIREVPDHLPAMNSLAYLAHLQEEYDQARELYERILQLNPDHASARYMHSILEGSAPEAPPPEYIRELFDRYSGTFEENLLEDLAYNLYLDLRMKFDAVPRKKQIFVHGLDLGCGTGLAGEAFRTTCIRLSGVDLSPKMIEQAGAKNIYDALHTDEIVSFLHNADGVYDLFIAADVLIYRGDLHPVFKAAAEKSAPDALFCLSIEKAAEYGWFPLPTGRYAHHPEYVRNTARDNGWRVLLSSDARLRREGDAWICGTLFVLARS